MFIHIYNKTCHSSIPDSKTAAYGHQSNSGRNMLGQYRTAVISKWHSYLDFADVEINIHGTAGVIELQVPWNAMEFHGTSRVIEISALQVLWNSTKFNGTARVIEIVAFEIPWNSMEFHGTSRVSEIGAFQVPWNSMEFHGSARVSEIGAFLVPWNCLCQRY